MLFRFKKSSSWTHLTFSIYSVLPFCSFKFYCRDRGFQWGDWFHMQRKVEGFPLYNKTVLKCGKYNLLHFLTFLIYRLNFWTSVHPAALCKPHSGGLKCRCCQQFYRYCLAQFFHIRKVCGESGYHHIDFALPNLVTNGVSNQVIKVVCDISFGLEQTLLQDVFLSESSHFWANFRSASFCNGAETPR